MGYSRREKEEKRKFRSPINYIKLIILNKPRSNLVRRVFYMQSETRRETGSNIQCYDFKNCTRISEIRM